MAKLKIDVDRLMVALFDAVGRLERTALGRYLVAALVALGWFWSEVVKRPFHPLERWLAARWEQRRMDAEILKALADAARGGHIAPVELDDLKESPWNNTGELPTVDETHVFGPDTQPSFAQYEREVEAIARSQGRAKNGTWRHR